MTPPEGWPAGIDYDEAHRLVSDAVVEDDRALADRTASRVLDVIAPLIAKAVEEAEADAERLANDIRAALQPGRWRGFDGPDGVTKDEVVDDVCHAFAAHEARKAGR